MQPKVVHLGWDWTKIGEADWTEASAEFLPVALDWAKNFMRWSISGPEKPPHPADEPFTSIPITTPIIRAYKRRRRRSGGC